MKKILLYLFILLGIAGLGFITSPVSRELLLDIGVMGESLPISGTGSMYPTFPKSEGVTDEAAGRQIVSTPIMKRFPGGFKLLGRSFLASKLEKGDIVEFESEITKKITLEKYGRDSGFVKRVIGLPGDSLELRDGDVYINNQILNEPYIAKPKSTYGGDFLEDCRKLTVPSDSVFVMGDNRKASLDSRFELGFVKMGQINYVLDLNDQDLFKKNWTTTGHDPDLSQAKDADPILFIDLLNKIRREKNLTELKSVPNLNKSATIRGEIILETDDFSVEATRSGLTLDRANRQSGYRNIITAEVFAKGFFEPAELMENLFEFPDTKKLLLSPEFQDIGLSAVKSDIRNCPTQVNVIHLGGYKPPEYKNEDIKNWKSLIDNLAEVLPSWESIRNTSGIDGKKAERLIYLLQTRLSNARLIYSRLSANQWLTDNELNLVEKDIELHKEAQDLIGQLNAQN